MLSGLGLNLLTNVMKCHYEVSSTIITLLQLYSNRTINLF